MSNTFSLQLCTMLVAASLLTGCGTTSDITSVAPTATPVAESPDAVSACLPIRVGQVSVVKGTVSHRPADAEEWARADVNQPVFEGSELFADDNSSGEVVLGDNRYVRFTDGADLEFTQLDPEQVQLDVAAGTVTLDVDGLGTSERYELNTPGGAIVASTGAEFRIDIDGAGDTWLTVRRGTAQVMTTTGTFDLTEGDRVNLGAGDLASVEVSRYDPAEPPDSWDRWNDERRVYYAGFAEENDPEPVRDLYGRNDIYGLEALATAGRWRALEDGRHVWHPRVDQGWQPYGNGRWDYSPRVGWTWISRDSWGWAPYHYGRWDHDDRDGWYWSPWDGVATGRNEGDREARRRDRYSWRPAHVYMFQAPRSKRVAWVPLAYGEPDVDYTRSWKDDGPPRQQADFVPRHLRDGRGIAYVSDDGFNRRERARRADRRDFDRDESFDAERPTPYFVPNPHRVVSVDHAARVRPPEMVRERGVVVRADDTVDHRANRRHARADRPVRKADSRRIDAHRSDDSRSDDRYRNRDRDRDRDRDHNNGDRDRDRDRGRDRDRDRNRDGDRDRDRDRDRDGDRNRDRHRDGDRNRDRDRDRSDRDGRNDRDRSDRDN